MPTTTTSSGLKAVQDLYILQMELWKILDGRVRSPEGVKSARKTLLEFSKLLKQVDWRYMGGEDVYQALEEMAKAANKKLQTRT